MLQAQSTAPKYWTGLTTLDSEIRLDDVPVRGRLPEWLTGTLLRTGPAKFEVGSQRYRHWFDGLAMLHRFSFAGGRVSYANCYLESQSYREAVITAGFAGRSSPRILACRSLDAFARCSHHGSPTTATSTCSGWRANSWHSPKYRCRSPSIARRSRPSARCRTRPHSTGK